MTHSLVHVVSGHVSIANCPSGTSTLDRGAAVLPDLAPDAAPGPLVCVLVMGGLGAPHAVSARTLYDMDHII